jgi:hypothetical protein
MVPKVSRDCRCAKTSCLCAATAGPFGLVEQWKTICASPRSRTPVGWCRSRVGSDQVIEGEISTGLQRVDMILREVGDDL